MKVNCEPQSVVDTFEAIDNNDDKLKYVVNILESCGIKSTNETVTIKKKKRAMTGWLCYLKDCQSTGMAYSNCMTDKTRKERLYIPKKDHWNDLAKRDCIK